MTSANEYYFCSELRKNDAFFGECSKNYLEAMNRVENKDGIGVTLCHLGFLTFGAWIRAEGKVLGTLGGCMVMPKKKLINRNRCRQICRQYSYDGNVSGLFKSLDQYPVLSEEQLKKIFSLFKEMADAVSAIATKQYQLKLEELRRARLSRYFSPSIFNMISEEDRDLTFRGDATILFSDIRDFTAKSEDLKPEEVVELLNEYFEKMVEIIFKNNGTLDKFIGDAILAVFGAPIPSGDNAFNAVQAAQEMLAELGGLNAQRLQNDQDEIRIGVGIHTGEVVAGNIGRSQRIEYTVIGDTVNVASRLESLTKDYAENVIISEATYAKVSDRVRPIASEDVFLKGKTNKMKIYRL